MAKVSVENLVKRFGEVEVLHAVSLDIEDKEFVVLVGPSGCGKTTLLRMIAGLEGVTSGRIEIDGAVVNDMAPKDRDIAMVFQNYALYPHMTVAENMGFSMRIRGAPASETVARVKTAAEILGLGELLDRRPSQLSGGQRQRVAMGRAIVRDPKVFLFDEPLSNLDAKLRVQMRAEIKALHQRLGTTIVYVTHDQIEAMTMADKIVVMRNGNIEQVGHPLDLYDNPANVFVAGFLGSPAMNFLAGRSDHDGERFNVDGGGSVALGKRYRGLAASARYLVGVRPEHLELGDDGLPATVTAVEPTGSETLIQAMAGAQTIAVLLRDRVSLTVGDRIMLKADPARIHLFDAKSEARVPPRSAIRAVA